MKYLCDTNIISELASKNPNPGVDAWAENITEFAVSVITVEEIHYGLSWHPNLKISEWIDRLFHEYATVLPVNNSIAARAGSFRGGFQSKGISRTQADMLIAATAAVHNLVLVTRNTRDFSDCGISLLNPFV